MTFDHYGVPTTDDRNDAGFQPLLKLHFSSSINPLFRIEYLKFEDDCIFSKEIQTNYHLAFLVEDIDETIASINECEILQPKTDVSPTLTICYIKIEGIIVELMKRK